MTGLALTTSLSIGGAPAIGAVDGILTAADDRRGKPDRASTDNKDHEGKRKQGKRRGTPVPCSADALIAAITLGNARGGAVLDLAKDCTYLLTAEHRRRRPARHHHPDHPQRRQTHQHHPRRRR